MNTQRPRYEIGYVNPEEIHYELKRFVDRGEFPESNYQKPRPEISRNFYFSRKFLNKLFRRN